MVYELFTNDGGILEPLNYGELQIGQRVMQSERYKIGTVCAKSPYGWLVIFDDGDYADSQTIGALSPFTRITATDEPLATPERVAELLRLKAAFIVARNEAARVAAAEKASQKAFIVAGLRAKYPWAKTPNASKNMKTELVMAFPGVKFSVRRDGSSIDVRWDFGPTVKQVEAITAKYQDGDFDGMQDMHVHDNSAYGQAVEEVLGRSDRYVMKYRGFGDYKAGFVARVERAMCELQGVVYEGGRTNIFPNSAHSGHHDTAQYAARQVLNDTTFPNGFTPESEFRLVSKENHERDGGSHWTRMEFPTAALGYAAQNDATASAPVYGVTMRENEAKNGVEIQFATKPSAETLAALKAAGFRWSRFGGLWYAKRNADTIAFAHALANPIEALRERFNNTAPKFQETLGRIAKVAYRDTLAVYEMWREYSETCNSYDQSPVLPEFVQWYSEKLGGNRAAFDVILYGEPEPKTMMESAPLDTPTALAPECAEAAECAECPRDIGPTFQPGDIVTFTPNVPEPLPVTGMIRDEVTSHNGATGYNIHAPFGNDTGRIVRVWAHGGTFARTQSV